MELPKIFAVADKEPNIGWIHAEAACSDLFGVVTVEDRGQHLAVRAKIELDPGACHCDGRTERRRKAIDYGSHGPCMAEVALARSAVCEGGCVCIGLEGMVERWNSSKVEQQQGFLPSLPFSQSSFDEVQGAVLVKSHKSGRSRVTITVSRCSDNFFLLIFSSFEWRQKHNYFVASISVHHFFRPFYGDLISFWVSTSQKARAKGSPPTLPR